MLSLLLVRRNFSEIFAFFLTSAIPWHHSISWPLTMSRSEYLFCYFPLVDYGAGYQVSLVGGDVMALLCLFDITS